MFKRFIPLLAVPLLLSACGHTGDESIKIGYIGPLTGDGVNYGMDVLNGIQLKIDEINGAGGIDGQMIELIAEDGRCTGGDGAAAAQKLMNIDNVVAIAGPVCSGETLAAAPIANSTQTPMISPSATSPDVTDAGDFVFRDVVSDALAAKGSANYLREEGTTSIAMITENTDFATAFGNALTEEMGADSFVFSETVEPGAKDFRTLITRMKDIDFDVLVSNTQTVQATAAMVQQFRELGFEQPILTNNGSTSPILGETVGEGAEGVAVVMPPSKGTNEAEFNAFAADFESKYGEAQSSLIFVATAYDALGILAEAIGAVGTDGVAIKDYLYGINYVGAAGNLSFDANGDVRGMPLELQVVQDGVFTTTRNISVE